MKKAYKILLVIIFVEIFIVSMLSKENIKIKSWIGNVVGTAIFLGPIQALLFTMGRDERFSSKKRCFFKVVFWFVIICYLLGGIAMLI